jgi:hypothetical protein
MRGMGRAPVPAPLSRYWHDQWKTVVASSYVIAETRTKPHKETRHASLHLAPTLKKPVPAHALAACGSSDFSRAGPLGTVNT